MSGSLSRRQAIEGGIERAFDVHAQAEGVGVAHGQAQRAVAGIGDGLVRLSVGLEHVEDLLADLAPALDQLASRVRQAA